MATRGPDTADADGNGDKKEAKPYSLANISPPCVDFKAPSKPELLNDGPAAQRFRLAPLRAQAVAVVPVAAGVKRSVVYVADGDASRIVVRERKGSKVTDGFATYRFDTFFLRPTRLAGFLQPDGKPALAGINASGRLFVRLSQGAGEWPFWTALDLPPGVTSVRDVDGLDGGTGELYVLAANGAPYARRLEGQKWSAWRSLGGAGYTALAAVKGADGRRLLFFVKSGPNVYSLSWRRQTGTSWTSKLSGAKPFGGAFFRAIDVDAVRDAEGFLHLFGIDGKTGLWERKTYGKPTSESGWGGWLAAAHLFIPVLADKTKPEKTGPWLEGAVSLTASRWAEPGTSGVPGLVALVVDSRGNVHQTTLSCAGANGPCYWRALRAFTE